LSRLKASGNEPVLSASGATLVASAHFINFKLCKKLHKQ
jgi:hypothetical protein